MPEPRNYIPQQTPSQSIVLPVPQVPATIQPARIDKMPIVEPTIKTTVPDQKVPVKDSITLVQGPINTIQRDSPSPTTLHAPTSLTVGLNPVLMTSSPTTPGAFPASNTATINETEAVSKSALDFKATEGGEPLEGSLPEDQRSVSTKVGSLDGGSTKGDRMIKAEYLREMEHEAIITAEDAADAAALDRYHREKYLDRYGYQEDEAAHFRSDRRGDLGHDDIGGAHVPDDLYEEPYSPLSGEHHSFFDDGEDGARLEARRFYDDDESQHSGSIPIQRDRDRDRGEYFASRARYEERDYDRSFQHYSSSMPTRQQQQHYLNERDQDQADWAASETASMSGYAREQYPSSREYPARPTLEDRERELEMMNQKAASASESVNSAAAARAGYGRRPGTASGTVAHLRRRFSDLSVTEMTSASGGMVSPLGPRPRGMGGSVPSIQPESVRRDSRYTPPPRASTPQSRTTPASGYRYEAGGVKGGPVGSSSGLRIGVGVRAGTGGRYTSGGGNGGHGSDYEDNSNGRMSVLLNDQRSRRR
ncbi:hypothetical protein BGX28_009855 [Mortierella sp. GBA30]|nr:hypothetical protein BGX28_009855 [Mortierella sp. GBA30]